MPQEEERKGPGAPKGNLNAFKHGRYSAKHQKLIDALAAQPQVRDALIAFDRAQKQKISRARKIARTLFARLLLGLPPNPDENINRQVQALLKAIASQSGRSAPINTSENKRLQKENKRINKALPQSPKAATPNPPSLNPREIFRNNAPHEQNNGSLSKGHPML